MTKAAFENAIRMVMVTGGSTNAVLHLIAMSRSVQDPSVAITLEDFQKYRVTIRVNSKPVKGIRVVSGKAMILEGENKNLFWVIAIWSFKYCRNTQ